VKVRPEKVEKQAERYRVSYELHGRARRRDAALNQVAALEGVRKVTVH
jgi:hypothetical protein